MAVFLDVVAFVNELKKTVLYKIQTQTSDDLCSNKVIGFDYGTYKIGVAISDEGRNIAFPKKILINKQHSDVNFSANVLLKTCIEYSSKMIVIGLPRNRNGELTTMCHQIILIAHALDKLFVAQQQHAAILLFDERFSTKSINAVHHTRLGSTALLSKHQRRTNAQRQAIQLDDARAACIILNDVIKIINQHI